MAGKSQVEVGVRWIGENGKGKEQNTGEILIPSECEYL
jgi:hypothetical protein